VPEFAKSVGSPVVASLDFSAYDRMVEIRALNRRIASLEQTVNTLVNMFEENKWRLQPEKN
jgi:hypothetical protein